MITLRLRKPTLEIEPIVGATPISMNWKPPRGKRKETFFISIYFQPTASKWISDKLKTGETIRLEIAIEGRTTHQANVFVSSAHFNLKINAPFEETFELTVVDE